MISSLVMPFFALFFKSLFFCHSCYLKHNETEPLVILCCKPKPAIRPYLVGNTMS